MQHLALIHLPPLNLRHERVIAPQTNREHDVADVQDARRAVCALDGDVPLVVRVLCGFGDCGGGPDVQLERIGIELKPVRELEDQSINT